MTYISFDAGAADDRKLYVYRDLGNSYTYCSGPVVAFGGYSYLVSVNKLGIPGDPADW